MRLTDTVLQDAVAESFRASRSARQGGDHPRFARRGVTRSRSFVPAPPSPDASPLLIRSRTDARVDEGLRARGGGSQMVRLLGEDRGVSGPIPDSGRPPFSMVLPPPNVTGWLHIGHALNQTLPDVVARWKRDARVRRAMAARHRPRGDCDPERRESTGGGGKSRHDLGREAFEARVWEWVAESRGTITARCASSAPRSTGRASGSRWTRTSRVPSGVSS